MNRLWMGWLAGLSALSLLFAAPALAAPRDLPNPSGPWSPPADAKVVFPETIGEYRRARITEFQTDDWSVNYWRTKTGDKLTSVVTVYFFSWPDAACSTEFTGAIDAMRNAHPTAKELARGEAASPLGGTTTAQSGRFTYKADFDGDTQAVTSQVYVYCHPGSRWTIKARSSWIDTVDGAADTAAVLRGIGWPTTVAK